MVIIFAIIGLMSLVGGLYLTYVNEDESKVGYGIILCVTSILWFILACLIGVGNTTKPTTLDVYRGRTTLEITYKDSVAIDSVVVFKRN